MPDQLNILMIGWEFPPAINGGLGVACHDLCMALSAYGRVSMIVPKSSSDFVIQQGELIGVNNVDVKKLMEMPFKEELKSFAEIYEVESELNPYYHVANTNNQVANDRNPSDFHSLPVTPERIGTGRHSSRIT